jgi:hypothetical protein
MQYELKEHIKWYEICQGPLAQYDDNTSTIHFYTLYAYCMPTYKIFVKWKCELGILMTGPREHSCCLSEFRLRCVKVWGNAITLKLTLMPPLITMMMPSWRWCLCLQHGNSHPCHWWRMAKRHPVSWTNK